MKNAGGLSIWRDREQLGSWRHTITLIPHASSGTTEGLVSRVFFHLCEFSPLLMRGLTTPEATKHLSLPPNPMQKSLHVWQCSAFGNTGCGAEPKSCRVKDVIRVSGTLANHRASCECS